MARRATGKGVKRGGTKDEYIDFMMPKLRSTIDNAISEAFRQVIGWDPMRDGVPKGTGLLGGATIDAKVVKKLGHRHRRGYDLPKVPVRLEDQVDPSKDLPKCAHLWCDRGVALRKHHKGLCAYCA